MSIGSTDITAGPYTTNGSTTNFSFSFRVADYGDTEAEDQVKVVLVTIATGAETVLTRGVNAGQYTVAVNSDQDSSPGGSITTITTYASGYYIYVRLNPVFTQQTELQNQGAYNAETVEGQFDQHARQILDLRDKVRRIPRLGLQAGESFDGEVTGTPVAGYGFYVNNDLSGFYLGAPSSVAVSSAMTSVVQAEDFDEAMELLDQGDFTATGADVARNLADRFADTVNVLDYIPQAEHAAIRAYTSTTDVQSYIDAAIADAGNFGSVYFPRGRYRIGDVVEITKNVRLHGDGKFASVIDPLDAFGATTPNIRWKPSTSIDCTGIGANDLYIGRYGAGTRAGAAGIHIDTTVASSLAPSPNFERVYIGQATNYPGMHWENDEAQNVTGAIFGALVMHCSIKGGVLAEDVGDTNRFVSNSISGVGDFDYDCVPGATKLVLQGNSITVDGGTIVKRCYGPSIKDNTFEMLTANTNANDCMLDLLGTSGLDLQSAHVVSNTFYADADASISQFVRVGYSADAVIERNYFDIESGSVIGVLITSDATDTTAHEADNDFESTITTPVSNAGVTTTPKVTLGLIAGALSGMTLANNGTDATNDIDFAAGVCADSTGAEVITCSALTKRLDASWAAGTNQGGLDTGSIADTTYHCFAIKKDSDGSGDFLFSTSATSPTMPSGYTKFRRIGSIIRKSSAILAFSQSGDEFLLSAHQSDITANNPGTSAVLRTLTVPAGLKVQALVDIAAVDNTPANSTYVLVTSPDQADTAAAIDHANLAMANAGASVPSADGGRFVIRTNTSRQIRTRHSDSTTDHYIYGSTAGWIDTRGRV